MLTDGQRTKWRRNNAENFTRLSLAHERYRQTTDDRRTDEDISRSLKIGVVQMGGSVFAKLSRRRGRLELSGIFC